MSSIEMVKKCHETLSEILKAEVGSDPENMLRNFALFLVYHCCDDFIGGVELFEGLVSAFLEKDLMLRNVRRRSLVLWTQPPFNLGKIAPEFVFEGRKRKADVLESVDEDDEIGVDEIDEEEASSAAPTKVEVYEIENDDDRDAESEISSKSIVTSSLSKKYHISKRAHLSNVVVDRWVKMIDTKKPWESMEEPRATVKMQVLEDAEFFLKNQSAFIQKHRQAIWERQHWVLVKSRCGYYKARRQREHAALASLRKLKLIAYLVYDVQHRHELQSKGWSGGWVWDVDRTLFAEETEVMALLDQWAHTLSISASI